MRVYFLSIVLLGCSIKNKNENQKATNAIETISLDERNSCTYIGSLSNNKAYSFKSDEEAENALKSIMKHTGLPTNFLLVATDVDNAAAVIYNDKRYILYNQRFMEDVKAKTNSKYGALSILSHEIAHHLSGHTLLDNEARPNLELEADRFSGFILEKMGATIDEACIAMEKYGSESPSSTHPAKKTRIAAIVNGWKEAKEDDEDKTIVEIASPISNQSKYIINVISKEKYITLRNRTLSPEEYKIGNSGTQEGYSLNKETIIMNLPNGTEIEVLSSIGKTYYVKAKTTKGEILGYIAKSFAGQSTIKQIQLEVSK